MHVNPLSKPVKRKVFISYHHKNDQKWFDEFTRRFATNYEVFSDTSLDGRIRSDDPEYVNRRIREDFIVGSSITIVLCGSATWKRKYVDWEIYSTLHHKHALFGIVLPSAALNAKNEIIVPDRFVTNVRTGYAHWIHWNEDPNLLKNEIEIAIFKSIEARLIDNSLPKMEKNSS